MREKYGDRNLEVESRHRVFEFSFVVSVTNKHKSDFILIQFLALTDRHMGTQALTPIVKCTVYSYSKGQVAAAGSD